MKQTTKFTVDRTRWKTATQGRGVPQLLNPEGYQCCLGFVAEQLGVAREEILDVITPDNISMEVAGT